MSSYLTFLELCAFFIRKLEAEKDINISTILETMQKRGIEDAQFLIRREIRFTCATYVSHLNKYTERQKKLITFSGRRSLKSTLSKLLIFGHK